jgi:hypothetical protein
MGSYVAYIDSGQFPAAVLYYGAARFDRLQSNIPITVEKTVPMGAITAIGLLAAIAQAGTHVPIICCHATPSWAGSSGGLLIKLSPSSSSYLDQFAMLGLMKSGAAGGDMELSKSLGLTLQEIRALRAEGRVRLRIPTVLGGGKGETRRVQAQQFRLRGRRRNRVHEHMVARLRQNDWLSAGRSSCFQICRATRASGHA